MPDKRPESQPKTKLPIGTRVTAPDGDGRIIGLHFRKNTNGGPGTRQYMVRLDDGRVHRYQRSKLTVPRVKP